MDGPLVDEAEIDRAEDRYLEACSAYGKRECSWDDLVEAWNGMAIAVGELGGMPILSDTPLRVDKRFPFKGFQNCTKDRMTPHLRDKAIRAAAYSLWEKAGRPEGDGVEFWNQAEHEFWNPPQQPERYKTINMWRNKASNTTVWIFLDTETNKIVKNIQKDRWIDRLNLIVKTANASAVYSTRAELKAQDKLKKHVNDIQFRQYVTSGALFEQSKRSRVMYMFRKSRPTVAFSGWRESYDPLCCLCMHPAGYYHGTWAGALCPTDDVIAHLLMMRTDEKQFWKRSHHHDPSEELSGI